MGAPNVLVDQIRLQGAQDRSGTAAVEISKRKTIVDRLEQVERRGSLGSRGEQDEITSSTASRSGSPNVTEISSRLHDRARRGYTTRAAIAYADRTTSGW